MVEKDFQSLFKNWLGANMPTVSTVYELKLEKKNSIAFNRVYDHQVIGLRMAKYGGLYHKIPDSPVSYGGSRFNKPKPFDCFVIIGSEAYVVILFYEPRKDKLVFFIDIDAWIEERDTSTRKSLTKDRAREISSKVVIL